MFHCQWWNKGSQPMEKSVSVLMLSKLSRPHNEISLAHSTSQTKQTLQQEKVCWHGVLDCGLGPRLVTRTIRKHYQLGVTVLKQGPEQQQHTCVSIRQSRKFKLDGLRLKQKLNWHSRVETHTFIFLEPYFQAHFC